jgi:hypothetical protein
LSIIRVHAILSIAGIVIEVDGSARFIIVLAVTGRVVAV